MNNFFTNVELLHGKSFDGDIFTFTEGPFNHHDNSVRIYLDVVDFELILDQFLYTHQYLIELSKACFNDSENITYVFTISSHFDDFPSESFMDLARFGIDITKVNYSSCCKYLPEEECFLHQIAINGSKSLLPKLIWGNLAGPCHVEPCFTFNMFLVSEDNRTYINAYDDRGVDIVSLDDSLLATVAERSNGFEEFISKKMKAGN